MIVALIDNGSLEPAAHRNLRAVAAALSERVAVPVHAVSCKHSDRIAAEVLGGTRAWTLAPFLRAQLARGERDFLFVPFFISAQGAIGSALRGELEKLQRELGGFTFAFTDGLAARGALAPIVAGSIRAVIAEKGLVRPLVIVVDHGGPSAESAALRDAIAAEVRARLASEIGPLIAASLEGADYGHARPLLVDALAQISVASGAAAPSLRFDAAPRRGRRGSNLPEVVVTPLFLAPGRHAGPDGDIARICAESSARCHLTALAGDHPAVVEILADALRDALVQRSTGNLPVLARERAGRLPALRSHRVTLPTEAGVYVS